MSYEAQNIAERAKSQNVQIDAQSTAGREVVERLSLAHAAWKAIEP